MKGKTYLQAAMTSVTFKDEQDAARTKLEYSHNIITQVRPRDNEDVEYSLEYALLIARCMDDLQNKITQHGVSYAQQYLLKPGLKIFKDRGVKATKEELSQMLRRNCFWPTLVSDMTPSERRKAVDAILLLTQKNDGRVKGRMVYNGKPTRKWTVREDTASPTAATESIFLLAVIDAKEERDVMSADVPNAFIQALLPQPRMEKTE